MTELEKALEQLKVFLEEAGYEEAEYLMTMSEEELHDLFRRFKREVRKKEQVYSSTSDEYKKLNKQRVLVEQIETIFRDREMEDSGLMPASTAEMENIDDSEANESELTEEAEESEQKESSYEECEKKQLSRYREATDVQTKQEIYREAARKAESDPAYLCLLARLEEAEEKNKERTVRLYDKVARSGNAKVAWELSEKCTQGILFQYDESSICDSIGSIEKSLAYRDIAAEYGHKEAILSKAYSYATIDSEKNPEKAYSLYKKYFEMSPSVSMENEADREAVYYYYKSGMEAKHDMLTESITVPLLELIKNEGSYTQAAKWVAGYLYCRNGRYDEAVELLQNPKTKEAVVLLEKIFFTDYFEQRPIDQDRIDKHLESMLYREDTTAKVREELFEWYGWRYEFGKKMVCNTAIAYAYYGKAALIGKWEESEAYRRKNHRWLDYKRRIYQNLSSNEQIVFFEKVLNYVFKDQSCYMDACLSLGLLLKEKNRYEEAIGYFDEGSRYAEDPKVKERCIEEYNYCEKKFTKQQVQKREAEESYKQCMNNGLMEKQSGFEHLRRLAKRGNTYAALRFAQVAEQDNYLKDTMKNDFPSQGEIFASYKAAAEAGEREAISRMVDIFQHGQLGQGVDKIVAERWRGKL